MKNKRLPALILAVLLAAALVVPCVYAEGRIVHIGTADSLRSLAQKCRLDSYSRGITVVLDADIDLANEPFEPIGTFGGTFIGNGHTIYNFTPATDGTHQALFRYVQPTGMVRNLNVTGTVNPENIRTQVGGVVATNYGTVAACSFTGEVRGLEMVGGVVGENEGLVLDCKCYGTVAGKRHTGGIVGYNTGYIKSCENFASVNITIETEGINIDDIDITDLSILPVVTAKDENTVTDSGGVVGLSTGIVECCTNNGTVGYPHFGYNVGGIAGRHSGFISDSVNNGYICGRKDIGGIVGQMEPFMILTATDSLVKELDLLAQSIDVAMTHLDENSDTTSTAMGALSENADSAYFDALEMDKNSEDPIVQYDEEDKASGIDVDAAKDKAEEIGDWGKDRYDEFTERAGDQAMDDVEAAIDEKDTGKITEEDWGNIGDAGTSLIDDARQRIEERKEKSAEELAEESGNSVEYERAASSLTNDMENMAINIDELNRALSNSTSQLAQDIKVVNYHFHKCATILSNILGGKRVIYQDISDEDTVEMTDGKVYACTNYGGIDGDIGIGGIGGDMGIELDYDLEGTILSEIESDDLFTNTYETRCVARGCVNDGSVSGKKHYIGGIIGYTELGSVIECEGYGSVASTDGNYVGGVVGRSDTVVRSCSALCEVSGFQYVGGVVGSGIKVSDCLSRVEVSGRACVGAIAGYADVRARDEVAENDTTPRELLEHVRGNVFVSDTLGGIDGISYGSKAEPLSDEEFMELENLPIRFKELTVIFTADGAEVAEVKGMFGEPLDEKYIPEVPEKAGFTGYWPECDLTELRSDLTLDAQYFANQSSLASENVRPGSPQSILLLQGSFDDRATLTLEEYPDYPPEISGCVTVETWSYSIRDNRNENCEYSVHFLAPTQENKNTLLYIYVMDGDMWVRARTSESGSHIVFNSRGNEGAFAVVEVPARNTLLYAAIGVSAAAVVAAAVLLLRKKKSAKSKAASKAPEKAEAKQDK